MMQHVLMCFANFEITCIEGQFCKVEMTRGRWKKTVSELQGEQHDNAEPEEGLQSGLEIRTQFRRNDFEVKKVPLRLISTAGKGEFKTYRNRYQLTFGRKAKKASGKCQGFHQDKLLQEC